MNLRKNSSIFFLLLSIALLIVVSSTTENASKEGVDKKITVQLSKLLSNKEAVIDRELEQLKNILESEKGINLSYYHSLFDKENIGIYVYEDSALRFWSNNGLSIDSLLDKENGIYLFNNAWCNLKKVVYKNYTLIGLHRIASAYHHQNKYLNNQLCDNLPIKKFVHLTTASNKNAITLKLPSGTFCFFTIDSSAYTNSNYWVWITLILLASTSIYFFQKSLSSLAISNWKAFLLFVIGIGSLRFISKQYQFPTPFYQNYLFGPFEFAASNWLSSLGDLLIDTLLLFVISYTFRKTVINDTFLQKKKWAVFAFVIVASVSAVFISLLLKILVYNSAINFNFSELFAMNIYSYIAIGIILLLILSAYLILEASSQFALKNGFKRRTIVLTSIATVILLYLVEWVFFKNRFGLFSIWHQLLLVAILVFDRFYEKRYRFTQITLSLFLLSVFTAAILTQLVTERELTKRYFLAQRLINEKDPLTEYLFENLSKDLTENTFVTDSVHVYWQNDQRYIDYIKKTFLGGYWAKYDVQITFCYSQDSLIDEAENKLISCIDLPQHITGGIAEVLNSGNHTLYETVSGAYFADITFKGYHLYILFTSKHLNKYSESGIPVLLFDEKELSQNVDFGPYSFAKYVNNKLSFSRGAFNYPIEYEHFENSNDSLISYEGYSHQIASKGNNSVLLSLEKGYGANFLTTVSYLFSLNSILFIILSVFLPFLPLRLRLDFTDFNSRLQIFLVGLVLLAITLFGTGTAYYIIKQNKQKNQEIVSDKIGSVLIEMDQKFGNEKQITDKEIKDYMEYVLITFSNVFLTEINFYDKEGTLLCSSRKELFDKGLLGKKMDIEAFEQMSKKHKSIYIHDEHIGALNYMSAYVPFENREGHLLGYINLPYYQKQDVFEKELSSFLLTLINSYVMLFIIASIVAVVFGNYIAKPLRILKERMSSVELQGSNEIIEWETEDEIGSLIGEYNRMVRELSESARKLAKSEREGAWREMAKQVAHEIKNPLTPMKLSIQHLKRAFDENAPDLKDRLEKTSKTLIEQINTLSNIANEFSNFAQMPHAKKETVCVAEIITNVIELHKTNENLTISSENLNESITIFIDREQLLRVFNNLIRNAIQAIDTHEKTGEISVYMHEKDGKCLIEIKDNGSGISDAEKDKIFVPNFTTKTSGTGLGLAMVKNIVNDADGEVWFESEAGIGTSFFLSFPIH